mgnify:CR=1 FL=1
MVDLWSPEAELAALRAEGLDRADPVRFAYLQALARRDLSRVKLMWVNYPHMPTGTPADPAASARSSRSTCRDPSAASPPWRPCAIGSGA